MPSPNAYVRETFALAPHDGPNVLSIAEKLIRDP